jgi:hypothetical protein
MNLKIEDLEKNDNTKIKQPAINGSPKSTARKYSSFNDNSK